MGDVIQYVCKSGNYTSLVTHSPISSRNYVIEFAGCTDPDGQNYPIVTIGGQTWMAGNLAFLPNDEEWKVLEINQGMSQSDSDGGG